MADEKLLLIGCGILKNEVKWLIDKNAWPLDTFFLDSSLHIDFNKLSDELTTALDQYKGRDIIVFYGACHPLMHKILEEAKTFRTVGQNCVEMLLGNERFTEELTNGAFFLIEDWALRWDYIIGKTFGNNPQITKDIFHTDRKYLLCLNTPCSSDFTAEAESAGRVVDLPVRWLDVTLDHLESVLQAAIDRKIEELDNRT